MNTDENNGEMLSRWDRFRAWLRLTFYNKIWPAMRAIWFVIKETLDQFSIDRAWQKSAAIAYFMLISLAPALLVIVRVAGFVYPQVGAESEIIHELETVVGVDTAETVGEIIDDTPEPDTHSPNIFATVAGISVLLVGATSVLSNLKHAINSVWGIDSKETRRGFGEFIRTRIVSIFFLLGVGISIVALMVMDGTFILAERYFKEFLPLWAYKLVEIVLDIRYLRMFVRIGVLTILIAAMYKVLPDVRISWRDTLIGAGTTALLMTGGQALFGIYLKYTTVASAYGAAGSLVLLLVWIYYSALAFFFGVEFTYVYATHYGSQIELEKDLLIIKATRRIRKTRVARHISSRVNGQKPEETIDADNQTLKAES